MTTLKKLKQVINRDIDSMIECSQLMTEALQNMEGGHLTAAMENCRSIIAKSDGIQERLAAVALLAVASNGDQKKIDSLLNTVYCDRRQIASLQGGAR